MSRFMLRLILILDRIVNLYMYYVGIACLLSWVPNINPNYPLFHFIFVSTGFYILPSFFGFIFAPLFIMVLCALISAGLRKLHIKIIRHRQDELLALTPDELVKRLQKEKLLIIKDDNTEDKDNNNDSI